MVFAIVAIAGLATAQFACSNDKTDAVPVKEEEPVNQNVAVRQGWLTFSGIPAFEATMKKLQAAAEVESLSVWEKQHKGYTSWRTEVLSRVPDEQEGETRLDIPDMLLTTVLNKDGRIQIADTIYQLVGQKEPVLYAIPVIQEAALLKGMQPERIIGAIAHKVGLHLMPFFPSWQDNDRVVFPEPNTNICNYPNQVLFPWWGQKGGLIYQANNGTELPQDNGRQVRLDYHRWRVGFLFYSSIGVRVKLYKNTRLAGWMSTVKMDRASIQSCSKGNVIIPGLIPVGYNAQVSASATNTNSLERTLKWVAAPLHVEVIPEHFNFDFSVTYRGAKISRSIIE